MRWQIEKDLPIYSQLIEQITLAVVSGGFEPGQRLPAVRELAMEAGVNPNTMQRALGELERDGLVYSQRTAGRYVTEDKVMIDTAKMQFAQRQILTFLTAMRSLGFTREETLKLLEQQQEEE